MVEAKTKVLLVEDNPGDVRLIEEMAKTAGANQYALTVVGTLDGALNRLRREEFGAVFLDLSLPDSSGLATMKSIQGNAPRLALVVITGLSDEASALGALKIGAEDFLVKGKFDGPSLVRSLKYAIERKRVEAEIRRSEARYRSLFDASSDILIQLDAAGNIVDVNQQTITLSGYNKKELAGKNIADLTDLFTPQSLALITANFTKRKLGVVVPPYEVKAIGSAGQELSYEVEAIGKDGRRLSFEINRVSLKESAIKESGELVIMHDITARKGMETALSDSENRFRSIFDAATDGIMLADVATHKFVAANLVMCNWLAYSLDEIKDMGVMDIHPRENLPYVLEQFDKMAKGEITLAVNIPLKRKDGSVFYTDISSGSIELAGKQYLTGIFRDITGRKLAEEGLKKKISDLEIFYKSAMGREDKILELKAKIEELKKTIDQKR